MTTHLDHLHDDGLVHRRPHPFDGRRYVVGLTPTGAATVKDAAAAMERAQSAFLERLDHYERDDLRHTLRRLEPPPLALGDLYFLGRADR